MTACRWLAIGIPASDENLSTVQVELLDNLRDIVSSGRKNGVDVDVSGWWLVAAQDEALCSLEEPLDGDNEEIDAVVSRFLREHLPPPATLLDVASWTGDRTRHLLSLGYQVSLLDPAAAALEAGYRQAENAGVGAAVRSLVCASFADLGKVASSSYDACVCLGSLLYAFPREQAERALEELARIAADVLVVEVQSKYGLLFNLAEEGLEVTAETVQQIVTTGTTPPARDEDGNCICTCFSSSELRQTLQAAGFEVRHLLGLGIGETLTRGLPVSESRQESVGIEAMLRDKMEVLDSCPGLLALCTRARPE